MIETYECPTCGRGSVAFAEIDGTGKIVCPACAPVPDKEPHDYRPVMLGGVALVGCDPQLAARARLATANLISGVCCADAGDCGHECGIA